MERTAELLLDPEGPAHEWVDAAEVRVGARLEVVRRLPSRAPVAGGTADPSVLDSNCTFPSAIGYAMPVERLHGALQEVIEW